MADDDSPMTKIIGNLEWRLHPDRTTWIEASKPQQDGWRLPYVHELVSIWSYRYNQCFEFPSPADRRWTWAAEDASPDSAWCVGFGDGAVWKQSKYEINLARYVRAAPGVE